MFESEINNQVEALTQVPREVVERFIQGRAMVSARTVLPWGEHCTECVWPTCYTTCELYSAREDGKCRRFVEGMVRIECLGATMSYLIKVRFKRWGKLWSPGNVRLYSLEEADQLENRDRRVGKILHQIPLPDPVRTVAIKQRYGWKKRTALRAKQSSEVPSHFVVECYNPGKKPIDLTLTLRPMDPLGRVPYEKLIRLPTGFHRERVPVAEISQVIDLRQAFGVDVIPNEIEDGETLYFGLLDFVTASEDVRENGKEQEIRSSDELGSKLIKCVVWDLDQTLWTGVLIEDGGDKVVLKPRVREIIQELDRRGIVQSVASKNNFDDAISVLKAHGLHEYFLYPQISWGPKSEAIKAVAKRLNLGLDTFLFVDDSSFELAEAAAHCPDLRVLNAERYLDIPDLRECQVPVTEEGANRRQMYRQEALRETAAREFASGDHVAFLRECQIEMVVERLDMGNLERVHELTQRTNQMNFSGNRYKRAALESILAEAKTDTFVLSCKDRFGSYGIIGFALVAPEEPRMTDLMFSCRVQSKRLEHAILGYLVSRYRGAGRSEFWANYRRTPRNEQSGRVFMDVGMLDVGTVDGISNLLLPGEKDIPNEGVVSITDLTGGGAPENGLPK